MQTEITVSTSEMADQARARAGLYVLIGVHFSRVMDTDFIDELRKIDFRRLLEQLSEGESDLIDLADGAGRMATFIEQTLDEDRQLLSNRLGVDRTRLYRGISPRYGPPPPYEAVWITSDREVDTLQTIVKFYNDSRFKHSPDMRERVDYIGVELDFMHALALSEAKSWENGFLETARETLKTQQSFLNMHLGSWAFAFIEEALKSVGTDFYKGHLLMVRGFLSSEQRYLAEVLATP